MAFEFFSELVDRYDSLKYEILEAQTFSEEHYGFPPIYYKVMETDKTRVRAFTKAFEKYDFNTGFQPIGAALGNVCFADGQLEVLDTGSTCVAWDKEVVDDTKYDLFPRTLKLVLLGKKMDQKQLLWRNI